MLNGRSGPFRGDVIFTTISIVNSNNKIMIISMDIVIGV